MSQSVKTMDDDLFQIEKREDMGLYYKDGGLIEGSSSEKLDSLNMAISAYLSVRSNLAYLSMPITSGVRYYKVFEHYNVKTVEELAAKGEDLFYEEIIRPNIEEGIALADELEDKIGKPIVAPSVFEAKKQRWSQKEYMFLWYRVFENRIDEVYMMDGWEYSNGGVQEFVRGLEIQFGISKKRQTNNYILSWEVYSPDGVSLDDDTWELIEHEKRKMGIKDQRGVNLRIEDGSRLISWAMIDLKKRGFETDSLKDSIENIYGMASYFEHQKLGGGHGPFRIAPTYEFDWGYIFEQVGKSLR